MVVHRALQRRAVRTLHALIDDSNRELCNGRVTVVLARECPVVGCQMNEIATCTVAPQQRLAFVPECTSNHSTEMQNAERSADAASALSSNRDAGRPLAAIPEGVLIGCELISGAFLALRWSANGLIRGCC